MYVYRCTQITPILRVTLHGTLKVIGRESILISLVCVRYSKDVKKRILQV